MKRALAILLTLGVAAVIIYLGVMKNLATQRAERLDRALQDAEARLLQAEAELQAARQQLAESRPAPAVSTSGTNRPDAPVTAGTTQAVSGAAVPPPAVPAGGGKPVLYAAAGGAGLTNLVRIEGTSTMHNWQVEGRLIGGSAEFDPGFPGNLGTDGSPTNLAARLSVFIPVRSLKSVLADGRPYSDAMDEIMYGKLRAEEFKRITFTLSSLTYQLRDTNGAYLCQANGKLGLAGVTNTVAMPVSILAGPEGRIHFFGSLGAKMTDFNMTPPQPSVPGGAVIKTGDEVTLKFWWWVKPAVRVEGK